MSTVDQLPSAVGEPSDESTPHQTLAEHPVQNALVSAAMIERAKTVIVVAQRVDDDRAAQMLAEAAVEAGVPVPVVADQVMTALQSDAEETIAQSTLVRALGAIRPSGTPPGAGTQSAGS